MTIKIYDSDRHVMEPISLWRDYVEPAIFNQFPVSLKNDTTEASAERIRKFGPEAGIAVPPVYMIGDHPILNHWGDLLQIASAKKSRSSHHQRKDAMAPTTQLRSMNESGIDRAAIFPTFAGFIVNHQAIPAEASLAYADGYNRWLKDYCSLDPVRLKAIGLISRHEPANMINQLEKIVSFGWSCITLRTEVIAGRTLAHPDYFEFWHACEHYGISVAFHGSTHLHAATAGTDRFLSRFALHACSHPMEAQMAFVSLLEAGVLERHPNLKFAFLEAGASWVPHWLWRLDNICYPEFAELTRKNIKTLPSLYFKRQCWVSIEIEEPCLRQVVDVIGHDKLLFGTDFPHPDHLDFDISDITSSCKELSNDEIKDVLQNNPKTFFNP